MANNKRNYIPFTKEMKKTHTILCPNMLPMHFELVMQVLRGQGYKAELLHDSGPQIAETGLRYVHNDACYPAILVVGQLIHALQSGRYDPHKVAFLYFQTGGGCRASNYIFLLRKALERAGFGYVPVISLSLAGLESHPGFRLSLTLIKRMIYAVVYGDLLMNLTNQVKPYEIHKGETEKLAYTFVEELAQAMQKEGISFRKVLRSSRRILDAFAAIPVKRENKVLVGVVGEIYVKYSPLGNNGLVQFLIDNGAEAVVPGLLDFAVYCVVNNLTDTKLYGMHRFTNPIVRIAYRFLVKKQAQINALIGEKACFRKPTALPHTIPLVQEYIGRGVKMGEGWLLTAEMLELCNSGVTNIVCAQPFGCLPNHICGKGMMKPLKDKNPNMNIVAIDYDPGATRVNQENRLKLMLANARDLQTAK